MSCSLEIAMTYNKMITEGLKDGSIKAYDEDGLRVIKVRPPTDGEVVLGYCNFSECFYYPTPTEQSGADDDS